MSSGVVVFIAFEESDNLGVRYISSVLAGEGYTPLVIDFREGKEKILRLICDLRPSIVGFSIIFQYHIYEFRELINYLRSSGITAHLSAGGQYASMRYEELFKLISSLDSVVRFEGEFTFLELANHIHKGTDWHKTKGLVYRENGELVVNQLQPPEMDLDRFPYPMRPPLKTYALGKKFATLLAGRGCLNNCSFCNNTEYIKQSSSRVKRTRKPEKVAEEMDFLFKNNDCRIFMFEDDDFPLNGKAGSEWVERFCKELENKKLSRQIIWKINCRPDEVDSDIFALMKNHGLFQVFLGIDDGTDTGLARLNKRMTIDQSLRGINILKELEICADHGFMLFQPDSDFRSVNDNLIFLRNICADGFLTAKFLKIRPYFETKIERELKKQGRLKGKPGFLDYDFLDKSMDHYYNFVRDSFKEWINHPDGIANISEWAKIYVSVFSHLYGMTAEIKSISAEVQKTIAGSNMFLLDTMRDLAAGFESGSYGTEKSGDLKGISENIKKIHNQFREHLFELTDRICRLTEYQNLKYLISICGYSGTLLNDPDKSDPPVNPLNPTK